MSSEERLRARLDGLRDGDAYRCYERVRREVLRMKDAEVAAVDVPSSYWREELANIEYMLDASPLVIEKLRHHTLHVTGVRPYEYRSNADKRRGLLAEKLAALREIGGDDLLVPEPGLLGGFGFEIDGELYNIDTLKFFEALIALDAGEMLTSFREAGERPVCLEIGPGWGGFGYQLKTLFPDLCYVLVDLPELFLFSGTYLLSAFPGARAAFWDDTSPLSPEALRGHDFVFVPNTSFASVRLPDVALAANMVSFQEMTTTQVRTYVERLYELGCPYVYSLNRDRSAYNDELTSVREVLSSRYWPHEIEVLPVPYTQLAARAELEERRRRPRKEPAEPPGPYRHVIGWRKIIPD